MTNSEQAIREFAEKWGFSQDKTDEGFLIDNDRTKQCLSDLTALISEGYVSKEDVNQEVERRIAERMPKFVEMVEKLIANTSGRLSDQGFYYWLYSRLTQKTEGGGE